MYPRGDRRRRDWRRRRRTRGEGRPREAFNAAPADDLFSSMEFLRCSSAVLHSRRGNQFKFGQAISAVQPGPAEIVRRKLCNLMIAATMLKPRPRPLVFRVLSER
jgi:hypothetical protein